MKVKVLRLGHRINRDRRLTTHVCLTSRALGVNEAVISGQKDKSTLESVRDISKRFGGDFEVRYEEGWRKEISKDDEVIHLTMYGLDFREKLPEIRKSDKDKTVIVGSEKVPSEVYEMADYNLAVTNQPHSEVAALSIFLDNLFEREELDKEFEDPEVIVHPCEEGKDVEKSE